MLKKTAKGLEVAILPDEIRASLPMMHLSDHLSNCSLLWECLQEGDNISNLMCINRSQQNIVSLVSGLKQTFIPADPSYYFTSLISR